jgi:hypothetical protein
MGTQGPIYLSGMPDLSSLALDTSGEPRVSVTRVRASSLDLTLRAASPVILAGGLD